MNIDELTLGQIKEIKCLVGCAPASSSSEDGVWEVGQNYLVRTVTMYIAGRLERVTPQELLFADAAWVADTGNFSESLKTSKFTEVEPFHAPVIVGRGAVVDATQIAHVPRARK